MRERSIYKSPEAEAEVMAVYDRLLARLPIKLEHRMIQTRFGLTQVTVAGPNDAPPLFALPGVHAPAPLNHFRAPTMVLLARDDLFVPVDRAVVRVKEIIPNLVSIGIFKGPHIPTKKMTEEANDRVRMFLREVSNRSNAA